MAKITALDTKVEIMRLYEAFSNTVVYTGSPPRVLLFTETFETNPS